MEPCSSCYHVFAVVELHRATGRCGDCIADGIPNPRGMVAQYTEWRRRGLSTEAASAAARALIASEAAAAE